ncbi:hypothetical protein NQZ68_000063 [Dissostichus eleginoides]|nr:hypothetical protein NQZ68_000063 [Dissostichus eleginoides]
MGPCQEESTGQAKRLRKSFYPQANWIRNETLGPVSQRQNSALFSCRIAALELGKRSFHFPRMAPEILDGTANCSSPRMSPSVCLSTELRHGDSDEAQVAKTAGCKDPSCCLN